MEKKKKTIKKSKKTKVYECAYHEFDCDDLGKYHLCNNLTMFKNECDVPVYNYCCQFCPGFKRGRLIGEWEISSAEKKTAIEFKKELKRKDSESEAKERALLKYLKEKYES